MSLTKSIPILRFKDFNSKWVTMKSSEIFISRRQKGDELLPMYSVTLDRGMIPREALDRKTANDAEPGDNLFVAQNDISYNMMRMWQGAFGKAPTNCMVSPAYVVLRPKANMSSDFFIYCFSRKRSLYLFTAYSYGLTSDRLRLYYKDFANIKFNVPTLSEQQKIASFLSSIDEKIQQLKRKKDLQEQYKKGVMQQLFSGKLRFKDENGKEYPKWEVKELGDLAEKVSKKNKSKSVNSVLTNSATQGIVCQSEYFDRDIANQNNLEGYYIVSLDDFVYNPRISIFAPVGPIKRNKLKDGIMSPLYLVFRFKVQNLEYFEFYFETKGWHEYLKGIANIGARHDRMNISNGDFFKMTIPFPCEEERKKIASFLYSIDTKLKGITSQINETLAFKKGLLQQMFV